MKSSLFTTLLSLATMTLMVMTVGSSGLRGLQSVSVENTAAGIPSVKITGLGALLQLINAESQSTNSTFDDLTLDSFSKNETDQGVEYDGKLTVANDQGFNITSLINGFWDPVSNKLVFEVSRDVDAGDNSTNTTNSTNPVVPAGYAYISPEDLANNEIAQNALSFGINALIQRAISQYKVPAASPEYNLTNLILAAYRNTSTGNTFLFYTNLTNALNYKVDANLTIRYRASNQTFSLAGYVFRSYGYPASAIVIPPPQNVSNNTNVTVTFPDNTTTVIVDNSTGSDNTTIIVDNPTAPDNTSVVDNSTSVDNSTVVIIPPVNTTEPENNSTTNATSPSNTTAPVNQTTADGYTIVSADQLDSIAQAALQYGANALIQKGISQNKIPAANPNYTISNIAFASFKKQVIGTSYKFVVNMINVDYVHVDTSLTVFYRYSTKAYSLNGYSFRSYNYSSSALSNTNVTAPTPIANSTSAANTTAVAANSTVVDNANSGSL